MSLIIARPFLLGVLCSMGGIACTTTSLPDSPPTHPVPIEKTQLFSLPEIFELGEIYSFIPEENVAFYQAIKGNEYYVAHNEQVGVPMSYLGFPQRSEDGKTIAYRGAKEGRWVIGRNQELLSPPLEKIYFYQLSPDGNTVIYTVKNAEYYFVGINDLLSPEMEFVHSLQITPKGDTVFYRARKQNDWYIGINHILFDETSFDFIDALQFKQEGSKAEYIALQGKKLWYKQIDIIASLEKKRQVILKETLLSKIPEGFTLSLVYAFNPLQKSVVYQVSKEKKHYLSIQNTLSTSFDKVSYLKANETANLVVYLAEKNGKSFLGINNSLSPPLEYIYKATPSEDGKEVEYIALFGKELRYKKLAISPEEDFSSHQTIEEISLLEIPEEFQMERVLYFRKEPKTLIVRLQKGRKYYLSIDGTLGPPFDEIQVLERNPKHDQILYMAKNEGKTFLANNEILSPALDSFHSYQLSQNGNAFVYPAEKNGKFFIGKNDALETLSFDKINFLRLSQDGNSFAYQAEKNGKEFLGINNKLSPPFDDVSAPIFWEDDKKVGFLVREGKEIIWQVFSAE